MKRTLILLAALCLLMPARVLGDGGLPEALSPLFEHAKAYQGYAMASCDAATERGEPGEVAAFVMEGWNHRELFVARREAEGVYKIEARSTLALWQGEQAGRELCIAVPDAEHIELTFGGAERFAFEHRSGAWTLAWADMGDGMRVEAGDGCTFSEGDRSAKWQSGPLYLDRDAAQYGWESAFNVSLFPRTHAAVRHLNRMTALMSDGGISEETPEALRKGRTRYPVYTAPSKASCRMAGGKAEVSLRGEVKTYGGTGGWTLISYPINPGVARVGYIPVGNMAESMALACAEATVTDDTSLTDDPLLGQTSQMILRPGDAVVCLARWDAYYAYVETKKDGKAIRGFVPIAALNMEEPEEDAEGTERLAGTSWYLSGGGTMGADIYRFFADGSCMESLYDYDAPGRENAPLPEDEASRSLKRWTVSRYDPALRLFWDDPEYMLTVTDTSEDVVCRYGLSLGETSLSLIDSEGSGAYRLLTEAADGELAVYPKTREDERETNRVRTLMHDIDCYGGEGNIAATVTREAGVTDGFSGGEAAKLMLSAGDTVTCLGCVDGMVFARVKGEKDGAAFEGYMPISALFIEEPEEDVEGTARLAGTSWFLVASAGYADILRFRGDGTCLASSYDMEGMDVDEWMEKLPPDCEPPFVGSFGENDAAAQPFPEDESSRVICRYRVSRYDPQTALFGCLGLETLSRYMITFESEDGSIERRGVELDEVSMIMLTGGSKGGYRRMTMDDENTGGQ